MQQRKDYTEAQERYAQYRALVYQTVAEEFPGITASAITLAACVTADSWKDTHTVAGRSARADWDWAREFPYYQRIPKRFEISLSAAGVLGALCYGQISNQGNRLRMNLIESTPVRPTPLGMRALPVIAFSAAAFAHLVGATEVWVLDPDPELENLYQKEGFGPRERYHGARVGQRRIL